MSVSSRTAYTSVARANTIGGCLLGMAVGDALGLPREGLSPRRAQKLFGAGELRHRLVCGRGMISDDTEHACMTAQSLLATGDMVDRFQKSLAWRLRWWLLGVPAGIGFGTLRAVVKLWMGVPAARSGVRSAGNGPAMRAPIIGVLLADRRGSLQPIVHASTRLTHRDLRAEEGALAMAIAAACAATHSLQQLPWRRILAEIRQHITDEELLGMLDQVEEHLKRGSPPEALAADLGLARGVSGYMYHTVPIALFCWLRYEGDFRESITQAIRLGGDTDTVAAITGALAGATVGRAGIPREWLDGLIEWPRSVRWMEELATRLARQFPAGGTGKFAGPQAFFWPGQLLRNAVFAAIVISHGLRRLLPPF